MMTRQEIEMILDSISEVCNYLYLHIQGEPLLHPELKTIMRRLDEKGMQVQLVSNASFLSENFWLLEAKCLRKISFSLHSIPYQSLSVQQYMKPVLAFARAASAKRRPYVELRFWNQDCLDEKSQLCLDLIKAEHPLILTSKKGSYQWLPGVYVHFDSQFLWPSQSQEDDKEGFCHGARSMIGILSDGTVVPCCLDAAGEINLGNIFTSSLKEILNGERYQRMQHGFQNRKLVEALCRRCSYRRRFD